MPSPIRLNLGTPAYPIPGLDITIAPYNRKRDRDNPPFRLIPHKPTNGEQINIQYAIYVMSTDDRQYLIIPGKAVYELPQFDSNQHAIIYSSFRTVDKFLDVLQRSGEPTPTTIDDRANAVEGSIATPPTSVQVYTPPKPTPQLYVVRHNPITNRRERIPYSATARQPALSPGVDNHREVAYTSTLHRLSYECQEKLSLYSTYDQVYIEHKCEKAVASKSLLLNRDLTPSEMVQLVHDILYKDHECNCTLSHGNMHYTPHFHIGTYRPGREVPSPLHAL